MGKFLDAYNLAKYLRQAFDRDKFDVAAIMVQFGDEPVGHFVLAIRSPRRKDDLQIAIVDPAMDRKGNVLKEVAVELNLGRKEVPIEYLPDVAAHPQDLPE